MKFNSADGNEMPIDCKAFVFGVEDAVVFAEFGGGGR